MAFSVISHHWDGTCNWSPTPWKTRARLSCISNTMAADDLVTHGARLLAAIVVDLVKLGYSVFNIRNMIQTLVGLFHGRFFHHNSNSMKISWKCCTWHDSCAVVACAKFCSDMVYYNWVKLKPIFNQIWITMGNLSWNGPQIELGNYYITTNWPCYSKQLIICKIFTIDIPFLTGEGAFLSSISDLGWNLMHDMWYCYILSDNFKPQYNCSNLQVS